jgi:hypothetical protein
MAVMPLLTLFLVDVKYLRKLFKPLDFGVPEVNCLSLYRRER